LKKELERHPLYTTLGKISIDTLASVLTDISALLWISLCWRIWLISCLSLFRKGVFFWHTYTSSFYNITQTAGICYRPELTERLLRNKKRFNIPVPSFDLHNIYF